MLSDASPTPYDLRFELFGFPVRIHPGFWIVAVILGARLDPKDIFVWVAAVLVSVLVHELGHAFLQRAYGGRPWIVLYTFGGYAATEAIERVWWKNVLVALAGPGAGFALWGVVYAAVQAFGWPVNAYASSMASFLLLINLFWGLLNLAPIWPLDGGRVARELLTRFLPASKGIVASLWLSVIAAVIVAALLFASTGSLLNLMLFGALAFQSYQALERYQQSRGAW